MGQLEILNKLLRIAESCKTFEQKMIVASWVKKLNIDGIIKVQVIQRAFGHDTACGIEPRG